MRDGDVVDVDLVALDQVEQQVERAFEALELKLTPYGGARTSASPSRLRARRLSTCASTAIASAGGSGVSPASAVTGASAVAGLGGAGFGRRAFRPA